MDFKIRNTSEYKKTSLEETFKFLETTSEGLSDSEVKNRLEIFGYNEIAEKKKNSILEFFTALLGPYAMVVGTGHGAFIHIEALS